MSPLPPSSVVPLGDTAALIQLGDRIDRETFVRVRALADYLGRHSPRGMLEYVPAFTSLAVYYDPLAVSIHELATQLADAVTASSAASEPPSNTVEIPVCYGGEFGPDLNHVATHNSLLPEEVVAIHSDPEYLVHMLGFAPGFPYLGGMSPRIATPRRDSPRLTVPAGSVGIAGDQTGVYPLETPGGWQLIGRTPLALFRPADDPPALVRAGDIVRFRPITTDEFHTLAAEGRCAST
jgi:inhibitor of KinA